MAYSARLVIVPGKRERPRRVFTWRNWLRRAPNLSIQDGCPLAFSRPRYFGYWTLGSAVGTLLRFEVVNRSTETIHSYSWRHFSRLAQGNGAFGVQPEAPFAPGQSREESCFVVWRCPLTLTVDFVQFANGSTWFSARPEAVVRPAGVQIGAAAAARYLAALLANDGLDALLFALPRIHADVQAPARAADDTGAHGFYAGVTNMTVRIGDLASRGDVAVVADVLRHYAKPA